MKKTDEILEIVEDAFLKVSIEVRYQLFKMAGDSTTESFNLFRADIARDMKAYLRPVLESYLETHAG